MNMIEATKACFSKYVTFSGRARRAEYWWFILATILVSIVLGVIDGLLGLGGEFGLLSNIWSLAVFLPSLAAGARRLHDTDRSAWWLLIMLLPLIGVIVLIVFFAQKGTDGPNRFGADPLRGDRAAAFN